MVMTVLLLVLSAGEFKERKREYKCVLMKKVLKRGDVLQKTILHFAFTKLLF